MSTRQRFNPGFSNTGSAQEPGDLQFKTNPQFALHRPQSATPSATNQSASSFAIPTTPSSASSGASSLPALMRKKSASIAQNLNQPGRNVPPPPPFHRPGTAPLRLDVANFGLDAHNFPPHVFSPKPQTAQRLDPKALLDNQTPPDFALQPRSRNFMVNDAHIFDQESSPRSDVEAERIFPTPSLKFRPTSSIQSVQLNAGHHDHQNVDGTKRKQEEAFHDEQSIPPFGLKRHRLTHNMQGSMDSMAHYEAPFEQEDPKSMMPHQPQEQEQNQPSVLNAMFDRDVEQFINENLHLHEQAVARWTDCTVEEWISGADEIAQSCCMLLDSVKTHFQAQVKALAGANGTIDDHMSKLALRQELLEKAKTRLLKESGQVLG